MRVLIVLGFLLAAITPAYARDDLMPPPKPARRVPVEVHPLEGAVHPPPKETREPRNTAPAPVVRTPAIKEPAADPHELEGKGEAMDGERVIVNGKEVRLFG